VWRRSQGNWKGSPGVCRFFINFLEKINMMGDVIKKRIGSCKVCQSDVFAYTREGARCFEIRYTCEHNDGYDGVHENVMDVFREG
jgi:hypothetical protein